MCGRQREMKAEIYAQHSIMKRRKARGVFRHEE